MQQTGGHWPGVETSGEDFFWRPGPGLGCRDVYKRQTLNLLDHSQLKGRQLPVAYVIAAVYAFALIT